MAKKMVKRNLVVILLAVAGFAAYTMMVNAGDLEPSAAPGPTMKTLDEVEPRIPISQTDIPLTISTPGSYYLTEDVTATGTAILVGVDNATIDLMGYSLIGPGKTSGVGIGVNMNGRKNVEIRNGTIRQFGSYGISENDSFNGAQHRVIDVRVVSNGGTGIFLSGKAHLVRNCIVAENAGRGMFLSALGNTVTGNLAFENGAEALVLVKTAR